jgi:hypothetical protein
MNNRKKFVGKLRVYREGPLSNHLSATVTFNDGRQAYWYRAPKVFENVSGWNDNIAFTAEEKGMVEGRVDLSNPRGVQRTVLYNVPVPNKRSRFR